MSEKRLNLRHKLLAIQAELKAPKGQFNQFGKYKYRSCEDILEAVKPCLRKYGAALTINDSIFFLENRFYVQAIAELMDVESSDSVKVSAFAREEDNKKGMDGSQLTGSSSSYARKYALAGLFLLDDTKDADTRDNSEVGAKKINNEAENSVIKGETDAAGKQWKDYKTTDLLRLYQGPKCDKLEPSSKEDLRLVLEGRGAFREIK